jgi:hypothetical protein
MKLLVASVVFLTLTGLSSSSWSSGDDRGNSTSSGALRQHLPTVPIKIVDVALGFEVELKVDNADVCVLWPKHLQDAGACTGVDTESFNGAFARVKRGPLAMAALRYDDGTANLTIMAAGGAFKSQAAIAGYMAGLADGLKPSPSMIVKMTGSEPGSPYDFLKIDGVDATHYEATVESPPNDPTPYSRHKLGYALFGDRSLIAVQMDTAPAHANKMRQSAASIIKTVRWSSPKSRKQLDHGEGVLKEPSRRTDNWVGGLVLLVLGFVVFGLGLKSRAKT